MVRGGARAHLAAVAVATARGVGDGGTTRGISSGIALGHVLFVTRATRVAPLPDQGGAAPTGLTRKAPLGRTTPSCTRCQMFAVR